MPFVIMLLIPAAGKPGPGNKIDKNGNEFVRYRPKRRKPRQGQIVKKMALLAVKFHVNSVINYCKLKCCGFIFADQYEL